MSGTSSNEISQTYFPRSEGTAKSAIGYQSIFDTIDKSQNNLAVGVNALSVERSETDNLAVGALGGHTSGNCKVAIGSKALGSWDLSQYTWRDTSYYPKTIFVDNDIEFNKTEKTNVVENGSIFTLNRWLKDDTCIRLFLSMKRWMRDNKMNSFGTTPDGTSTTYNFYNDLQHSPDTAELFHNNIKNFLTEPYVDTNGLRWLYKSVNPYLPWAMYKKGEEFGVHKDSAVFHSETTQDKMTCLIYLNDDFKEGQTIFYLDAKSQEEALNTPINKQVVITPQKGTALFFDIDLYHKGSVVLEGEKYWLGFEMIFERII